MKLPGGFELSDTLLLKFPVVFYFLLLIITLSVIKLAFGKEIIHSCKYLFSIFSNRTKSKYIENWTAVCKLRQGWGQKGDALALDLEDKYIKSLSFSISPIGKPINWRGGFIIGNEKLQPQNIVDTSHSITIHVGSPPPIDEAQYVWIYDWNHARNHPDSRTVKLNNKALILFEVNINDNNFISVSVNNQLVYSNRLDASYRRKAYLLGWCDYASCKVKFTDIRHSI